MPARPAAPSHRQVLIGTASGEVLDELLGLAAAARVEPLVAHDSGTLARWWSRAPLVLLGADLAQQLTAPPSRRANVVLVCPAEVGEHVWRRAVAVGAEEVAVLPEAAAWLVDRMSEAGDRIRQGIVVAVVGCVGGAGTTTLVASLARYGAGHGLATAVVDLDPTGADLDDVLDMVDAPGLRWSDLAGSRGRLPAASLRSALPERSGVTLVCQGADRECSPLPDEPVRAVLSALARSFDLVLVEVPRWLPDGARAATDDASAILPVTTADRRGVGAAHRLLARLPPSIADWHLVVRTGRGYGRGSGLLAQDVAQALGLPLAATLATDRRIGTDLVHADLRLRPALRRACESILGGVPLTRDGRRS